ncbi:MAG TPA: hypothetical protein VHE09_02080 [Rhizomicrobium sp.]|nr:hypothetical protein [Rhizomicrobium sp.]
MKEERPTRAALDAWIHEYPQFERELVDFASVWIAEDVLAEPMSLSDEEYDAVVNRVMSRVENLMHQNGKSEIVAEEQTQRHLTGLFQAAKDAGLDVTHFLDACRIDRILAAKLDARQIDPRSIPAALTDLIARTLRRRVDEVVSFLALPPRVIPNASFKARTTPQVSQQESFTTAVQKCALPQTLKNYWLAEAARRGPSG